MAFRVTQEEYDDILMRASVSGMQKQEYLIARALEKEIVAHPNIRVKKYPEQYLIEIRDELQRLLSDPAEDRALEMLKELLEMITRL